MVKATLEFTNDVDNKTVVESISADDLTEDRIAAFAYEIIQSYECSDTCHRELLTIVGKEIVPINGDEYLSRLSKK